MNGNGLVGDGKPNGDELCSANRGKERSESFGSVDRAKKKVRTGTYVENRKMRNNLRSNPKKET